MCVIRLTGLLLLTLVMVGCGYGSKNYTNMMGGTTSPPTMTDMSPQMMKAGSAFNLTVNGSNFGTGAVVYWGMTAKTNTQYVSANQLMVPITAADTMNSGPVSVYVLSGGMQSNTMTFDVQ